MTSIRVGQQKVVTQPSDLASLQPLLNEVVGRTGHLSVSYGDELLIDMDDPPPAVDSSPQLTQPGQRWVLATRGSDWHVEDQAGVVPATGHESDQLLESAQILDGSTIDSLDITFPDLGFVVAFTNGLRLVGRPDPTETTLPAWELFTPRHTFLRIGPGSMWSFNRADVPEVDVN